MCYFELSCEHPSKPQPSRDSGKPIRVSLCSDLVDALLHEKERSGVGTYRLFREYVDENKPGTVSVQNVQSWLRRDVATVRKDYIDYILQLWRSLPDNSIIAITPELRAQMRNEADRTGKGPSAMLRGLRPSQMNGLTYNTVAAWMCGKIRSADAHQVELVLNRWRSLPDQSDTRMSVLGYHIAHLDAELKRTGITHRALLCGRDDLPDGLTISVFRAVLRGTTKSIKTQHYDYLVSTLRSLPDRPQSKTGRQSWQGNARITLTKDMRDALRRERERTGVSEKALVAVIKAEGVCVPPKSPTVSRWITGKASSAPQKHYELVLARWSSLPDANAFFDS